MMRMLRRLTALCLTLLTLCFAALADAPLLQFAKDWQLDETPVEVTLKADIQAHMPYDEDRLAMLTAITRELSLRLTACGPQYGSVSVRAGNSNLITLTAQDGQLYLSSLPDAAFASSGDPMEALLGASSGAEVSLYGVSARSETLLDDGWVLMEKLIPDLMEKGFGVRKKNTTNIENMGKAGFLLNATIPAAKAGELREMLLAHCPEGWLREILGGLNFSGKQTFRIYQSAREVPLRFEYNGTCEAAGEKRTVKFVWRARRDSTAFRDDVSLTSPANSGNRNTLTFKRVTQTSKKGVVTTEGEYAYVVKKDKQTTELAGSFELKNAATKKADVITGSATFQQMLPCEKKFTALTFEPKLTISGTQEEPLITGSLTVTEKYGKSVTEKAVISVDLKRAADPVPQEAAAVIDLDALTPEELAQVQQEAAESVTAAVIRPLILLMGPEGAWFFHEMPEESVREVVDAAGSTQVVE